MRSDAISRRFTAPARGTGKHKATPPPDPCPCSLSAARQAVGRYGALCLCNLHAPLKPSGSTQGNIRTPGDNPMTPVKPTNDDHVQSPRGFLYRNEFAGPRRAVKRAGSPVRIPGSESFSVFGLNRENLNTKTL